MKKDLKVEERLIVAADYKPSDFGGRKGVKKEVMKLATMLKGTGVLIKVNSVLRSVGYDLIIDLKEIGLKVFADLKLIDISDTMATDAELLFEVQPDILTVMSCAGVKGMEAVQKIIGKSCEVLGVTVLTSLSDEDCQAIFTCSSVEGVSRFAKMSQDAGLGGLILSSKEVDIIKDNKELILSMTTPGIRPNWAIVKGDDQSRIMTPAKAISNGADRLVIGRPITRAENSYDAVMRILEEINQGLEARL